MRIMKLAGLVIGTFALFATPAAVAQQYPPSGCTLMASNSTVSQGGTLSLSTSGCNTTSGFAPGTTVTLTLASDPVQIGTVTADSTGNFSASVAIPASVPAGTHTVTASGASATAGTMALSMSITVVAPGAAPPSGATLPFTGRSHTGAYAIAGGAAVLLGGGLVVMSRRRRRTTVS